MDLPQKGLVIAKRLNTKETEAGINVNDLEYIYSSDKIENIIHYLCKLPGNRLSWMIVAKFERNEAGGLDYSDGREAVHFLKAIQQHIGNKLII
uniref:Uncharacterized protein n=1 Tax=uncultured marine virus TaxID=186617 RepID=A0A0F7L8N2_9VIRU|nr:hypothetical protein [uncultured marine virus]